MPDNKFIEEAIRRAESRGLYPSTAQRAVDWDSVEEWAARAAQPGFSWSTDENEIIVSRNGAVCDGQHRLLGGLMAGNPPPYRNYSFDDDVRHWKDDAVLIY